MRRVLVIALTMGLCLGISSPARGQSSIQIADPQVEYTLGGQLVIETEISSEFSIHNINVFLQPEGESPLSAGEVSLTPPKGVTYTLDLSEYPLRVFSQIEYWYQFELDNGQTVASDHYDFVYSDNRFDWQSLKTEEFEVYWYQGDEQFGQTVMNTAYEGLARIREQVKVPAPRDISIYVYANSTEMQTALQLGGQMGDWIAGHADPDLGTALVSIPEGPAQTLEIKRQIPHELAHILLYLKLGPEYQHLPPWLHEGISSNAELFPNPDYPLLLEKAYERQVLIPLGQLCQSFPTDAANFQLAYAEASSFTWWLRSEFGNPAMEELMAAYSQGLGCERGAEAAVGKTLSELELDWRRETFDEDSLMLALGNFIPWMVIFALVLLSPLTLIVSGNIQRRREKAKR